MGLTILSRNQRLAAGNFNAPDFEAASWTGTH
jgi:hypothetical protein